MTMRRIAFLLLLAATLAVYGVMALWSLPRISAVAGGLAPFDMRPAGYTFAEARAFIAALPAPEVTFYLAVQQKLDLAYPALLAATLFFAIAALLPARLGGWRWLVALIAIPGSVFDYLENAAVAAMLRSGADGLDPQLVQAASRWTLLKSGFTTAAMVLLLTLIVLRLGRWLRSRLLAGRPAP